jgi:hypothetical protein
MSNQNPQANMSEQAQKHWAILTQAGVWILGIVGGFLLPPPVGADTNQIWLKLAQFVAAASVGLFFLPARRWAGEKHTKWWWLAAAFSLIISIVTFFGYQHLTYSSTCNYRGQLVVMGNEYTPNGYRDVQETPGISCSELIYDFAGKTEEIWTKRSIDSARLKMAATYITCMPFFTVCIMSLVHALHCATKKR